MACVIACVRACSVEQPPSVVRVALRRLAWCRLWADRSTLLQLRVSRSGGGTVVALFGARSGWGAAGWGEGRSDHIILRRGVSRVRRNVGERVVGHWCCMCGRESEGEISFIHRRLSHRRLILSQRFIVISLDTLGSSSTNTARRGDGSTLDTWRLLRRRLTNIGWIY